MSRKNTRGLNIIGACIFLVVGLVYMLSRLLKAWGITWVIGSLIKQDLTYFHGIWRFFIYLAALVYLGVALIGFFASKSYLLAKISMVIGVIFVVIGLVALFKNFGLMALLKLIGGGLYLAYGLGSTSE
ncbi:MAG: hypothetical protein Q4P65_03845 [Eubacteriales bacterium]|nr:hypothetical protein [Eubacteriales bacterium]